MALLVNPASLNYPAFATRLQASAQQLGMRATAVEMKSAAELTRAFGEIESVGADCIYVAADGLLFNERKGIAQLALQRRLPTVSPTVEFAEAGSLMSYGVDRGEWMKRAAVYVDKIFKGARPGDLPIEETSQVELVINRSTAEAMQITVPKALLLQATRVIG